MRNAGERVRGRGAPWSALVLLGLCACGPHLTAQVRPNEPKGFKEIARLGFEGEVKDGWTKRRGDSFRLMEDAGAPGTGAGFGRAYYERGFMGGRGPVQIATDIPEGNRWLYLSFWVRLSDNWLGHQSGVNKIFHIWIAERNRVYLSAQGRGNGPYAAQVRLQGIAERNSARNLAPMRDAARLRRGEWHHWEVLLKSNTPGLNDGRVRWWIDGKPAGTAENVAFVPAGARNHWETVTWNPTWGGTGGHIGATQYMDLDEVYVSASP